MIVISWNLVFDLIFYGAILAVSFLSFVTITLKVISRRIPLIKRFEEEETFENPNTGKREKFPSIDNPPSLALSVIIPAFDEESRLPVMLEECLEFLEERSKISKDSTYEVIVVSDGSRDNTVKKALEYSKKYSTEKFRVLELIENRGKGGAVRLGMQSSRGQYLLFADADGATKFSDLTKLEQSMQKITKSWDTNAIVIGSRAHLEDESKAKRSFFRTILMHGFHMLVWIFAVRKIRDTQCGFKLMTRSAARRVFELMHVERWAFDVELLFIAQHYKMPIDEIAVDWTEIDGSKVTPFFSWIQMGRDLMLIWLRYKVGAWELPSYQQ